MLHCVRSVRPSGVVWALWSHARAVSRMVCAAPARWRRGDRRGAAAERARGRSSHDRAATGAPAGDGPRPAACRQSARGVAAPLRDTVGARAGPGAGGDPTRRLAVGRRGRGAREGRQSERAAARAGRLPVGAGGLVDGRAASRPTTRSAEAAAVARGRADSFRTTSLTTSCAGGCGSSAATAVGCSRSR